MNRYTGTDAVFQLRGRPQKLITCPCFISNDDLPPGLIPSLQVSLLFGAALFVFHTYMSAQTRHLPEQRLDFQSQSLVLRLS